VAAAATLQALAEGRPVLLDVAMARAAAAFAGPTVSLPTSVEATRPLVRAVTERGPDLDEHGPMIRREFSP
jgi:hypothetical protein